VNIPLTVKKLLNKSNNKGTMKEISTIDFPYNAFDLGLHFGASSTIVSLFK